MKNRTIKFRVWDVESSDMIQHKDLIMGDVYLQVSEEGMRVVMDDPEGENGPEVRDAVIMQYTGLKDKHGKEIYEGDIIRIAAGNPSWTADPFEVVFMHGAFQIKKPYFQAATAFASYLSECLSHDVITDNSDDSWLFEVIGNIYENPELCQ